MAAGPAAGGGARRLAAVAGRGRRASRGPGGRGSGTLRPTFLSSPAGQPLLLVDDHEDNLFALEHALAPLGRRLLRPTSGEQALKAVLRHPVATVVMDIAMPGIDGLDTMSCLSRLDQTREVPVLLITGTGRDDGLAERAYRMGAAGFLIKPVDPWALRCHVRAPADLRSRTYSATTPQPAPARYGWGV